MDCPNCKSKNSLMTTLIVQNQDRKCSVCHSVWNSNYVRAYWDGYIQCSTETRDERSKMIQEIYRLSTEWQSANRIIWCIAYSNGGEVRIEKQAMIKANDETNFIDLRNDLGSGHLIIEAKTDSQVKTKNIHLIRKNQNN